MNPVSKTHVMNILDRAKEWLTTWGRDEEEPAPSSFVATRWRDPSQGGSGLGSHPGPSRESLDELAAEERLSGRFPVTDPYVAEFDPVEQELAEVDSTEVDLVEIDLTRNDMAQVDLARNDMTEIDLAEFDAVDIDSADFDSPAIDAIENDSVGNDALENDADENDADEFVERTHRQVKERG